VEYAEYYGKNEEDEESITNDQLKGVSINISMDFVIIYSLVTF
jgi:hypothetical protein